MFGFLMDLSQTSFMDDSTDQIPREADVRAIVNALVGLYGSDEDDLPLQPLRLTDHNLDEVIAHVAREMPLLANEELPADGLRRRLGRYVGMVVQPVSATGTTTLHFNTPTGTRTFRVRKADSQAEGGQ